MEQELNNTATQAVRQKPLRLALIASENTINDYSFFLEHLLAGLADQSIPVALVCPPKCDMKSRVLPSIEVIDYPVIDLPLMGFQNKKMLIDQLGKFNPTVMHCLSENMASTVRHLSLKLNLPYILTIGSLKNRKGFLSISQTHCAKIMVPTPTIAANIEKILPKLADKIKCINVGTFAQDKAICFNKIGRLSSLVTAHPLDKVDDFVCLFGAIRQLVVKGYEFMLIIAGSGRAERPIRKLLSESGLLQVVTIVPRSHPPDAVLAAGDIFIRPQPLGAFDPLLLEAMSLGVSVAACKGGVDDFIIDGQTAVIFDPDDELSIIGRLQRLLDSPDAARKLAESAQKYLKQNNTVSAMLSSLLDVYNSAQIGYKS